MGAFNVHVECSPFSAAGKHYTDRLMLRRVTWHPATKNEACECYQRLVICLDVNVFVIFSRKLSSSVLSPHQQLSASTATAVYKVASCRLRTQRRSIRLIQHRAAGCGVETASAAEPETRLASFELGISYCVRCALRCVRSQRVTCWVSP